MFSQFNNQVEKPWAIYYSVSPVQTFFLTRLDSRIEAQCRVNLAKRQFPKNYKFKVVYEPENDS